MAADAVLRAAYHDQHTEQGIVFRNRCNPQQRFTQTRKEKRRFFVAHVLCWLRRSRVASISARHSVISTVCQNGLPRTTLNLTRHPDSSRRANSTSDAGERPASCDATSS